MKLSELVAQYMAARAAGALVVTDEQVGDCAVRATRAFAAYGDIRSISESDGLPSADGPGNGVQLPPDPEPAVVDGYPIKSLGLISLATDVTAGEWAVIEPLFSLYVERENALRLEATRGLGVDVFGRQVSEIAQDITAMETVTLPERAFCSSVITV